MNEGRFKTGEPTRRIICRFCDEIGKVRLELESRAGVKVQVTLCRKHAIEMGEGLIEVGKMSDEEGKKASKELKEKEKLLITQNSD